MSLDQSTETSVSTTASVPAAQQEQQAPPPQQTPNSRMFTEEEMAAARRQEKDKLYDRIEKMQSQLETFNAEREEQQRLADEAAEREAQERRQREEAEMSAKELHLKKEDEFQSRINTVEQEWAERVGKLEEETRLQKQILEQERRFQELESYKSRRLQEEQDSLMPELLDFIRGDSEDQIEAAISAVKDRTSAILENIQQSLPSQQRVRGIPATGPTPNGPMENLTEQQSYSEADIASMSMEQWAQVRDRLIKAASNQR